MKHKLKIIGVSIAFLLLLQVTAIASAGVAISPAKEELRVNINGENKTFTIFNTGTHEMKYVIDLGGNAAKFAEIHQRYITLDPESYERIKIYIEPTTEYDEDENYTLTVHPKFYIEGGIVSEAGVKATLPITFHGERIEPFPEPKEETIEDDDEPRLDVRKPEEDESSIRTRLTGLILSSLNTMVMGLIFLLLVPLALVVHLVYKKVRKNEAGL